MGVALGLWLMIETQLGVMGMAIGISISFVLRGIGFLAIRGAQYFAVPYHRFIRDNMGRPLGIAALAMLVSKVSASWISPDVGPWVTGGLPFVAATIMWFFGNWLWVLEIEHRQKLMASLNMSVLRGKRK